MFEQEKIAVSRLRQAYNLSATEADNLVLSLWPSKAFPLELWQEAHETYWRSFAERNASLYGLEIPSLPEVGDAQTFNSYLLSCDVMLFFRSSPAVSMFMRWSLACAIFLKIPTMNPTLFFQRKDKLCSMLYPKALDTNL